ncbi:MAG TPA: twin-arginine translocase subunit TatC [Mycobacteriales bacterium]|nr:twin-arginine translocase subunit TatC [Mycobacteriales bacterium]
MTLVEHLQELRARLVKSAIAFAAVAVAGFVYFRPILRWLERPFCATKQSHVIGGHCTLVITSPVGSFSVALHVALIVGALGSAPIWLWQLWAFITPGLHRNERRWAVGFVGSSLVLFAGGAAFAYLVAGRALALLLGFGGDVVTPLVNIDRYLSFISTLVLAFGAAFELPLVIVILNLAGLVSARRLSSWRRMEIFLVTAFAAVVVPSPDPLTMLGLAVPMALLYELAVVIARVHDRGKARTAAAHPYAGLGDDETSPLRMGEV